MIPLPKGVFSLFLLEIGSLYVAQAGHTLVAILLPGPPECWGYGCDPPHSVSKGVLCPHFIGRKYFRPALCMPPHTATQNPGPLL